MGWWSATILGGDSPLDDLGSLAKICGIGHGDYEKPGNFHGYMFSKSVVEKNLKRLVEWCEANKYVEYRSIAYQVLGAVVLHTGAKISKALHKKLIDQAMADEWMREEGTGSERGRYVQAFVRMLKAHEPGKSVQIPDQGLFEQLAKVIGG